MRLISRHVPSRSRGSDAAVPRRARSAAAATFALRNVRFCLLLAALGVCSTHALAQPEQGMLHWHNGDQLPGTLQSADAESLIWKSDMFENPLVIDLAVLRAVQYPAPQDQAESNQSFRVVTTNNDVLLGELVAIDDRHVEIDSPRHGRLRLDRHQLIGLQRHNRKAAGSVGLGLLTDWTTLHRGREISEWTRGAGGRIETRITGAELYRDLHLTSDSEIEVELAWTGKPGFVISFAGPGAVRLSKQVVKLETWESDLVLQTLGANGDFQVIQSIPEDQQSLALRLQWNPNNGELSVYSALGRLLGKMKGESLPASQLSGLYIQNKGATLDLVRLQANGWEGAAEDLPAGFVRARLADASTVSGKITHFDAAGRKLQLTLVSGRRQEVAVAQLDSIELGNPPKAQDAPPPSRITFVDGTQISGTFRGAEEGVVSVATSYSEPPVTADLAGVFAIRFAPAEPPEEAGQPDVLHFAQGRLRGRLKAVDDRTFAIGWQPVGGRNAGRLPDDQLLRITRAEDSTTVAADKQNQFLDRIFLRNGDAVPCNIHRIDDSHLHVDVPLTDNSRIDRHMAVAVEFGTFASLVSSSFADPQWVVPENARQPVTKTENELVFKDTSSVSYANIRDADEIAFDIKWNLATPTYVRIHLFADNPAEASSAPTLALYRTSGTQVMVQGMQGMGRGAIQQPNRINSVRMQDGRTSLKIEIRHNHVSVHVNEKQTLQVPVEKNRLKGRSLLVSVQQLNINGAQIPMINRDGEETELLVLENPSIRRAGGNVLDVLVDDSELNRLLTIPRFRKQSPPSEILVGQNGDLLRGRLVSLDDQRAVFASRLEEIVVPRRRLAGIVWPQSEEALAETASVDASLARILFVDGSIVRMTAQKLIDDALVGQHPALGPLAIPVPLTRELTLGGLTDTTHENPFAQWTLRPAEEPQFADSGGSGGGSGAPGTDSPLVDHAAPGFDCKMLDGGSFRIAEQKGKVVVLDFWATWCGPCVKSMPDTIRTIGKFPPDKVALVAVNQLETPATIRTFLEARQWDINVVLDYDGQIGVRYGVSSIPQLVVIDAEGMVRHVLVGDTRDLQQRLHQIVEGLVAQADSGQATNQQ